MPCPRSTTPTSVDEASSVVLCSMWSSKYVPISNEGTGLSPARPTRRSSSPNDGPSSAVCVVAVVRSTIPANTDEPVSGRGKRAPSSLAHERRRAAPPSRLPRRSACGRSPARRRRPPCRRSPLRPAACRGGCRRRRRDGRGRTPRGARRGCRPRRARRRSPRRGPSPRTAAARRRPRPSTRRGCCPRRREAPRSRRAPSGSATDVPDRRAPRRSRLATPRIMASNPPACTTGLPVDLRAIRSRRGTCYAPRLSERVRMRSTRLPARS